ncbi:MAG: hypothetical protein KH275_03280 [Clostridiales bacterium]|nr:hypothetical protein [Clostridiales bacterium]
MGSSIYSILLIPGLLCVFFLLGFGFTSRMGENVSVMYTILVGFFAYFAVFQCVALPMKIFLMPLSALSVTWMILLAILVLVSLVLNRKKWKLLLTKKTDKTGWIVMGIFAVLILVQIVVITNNIQYGSFMDASYYIGDSARSVATNTIEQYDQYTGRIRTELAPLYLLLTYTAHNSVLSYVTGIHSLVIWRQVMGTIVIILANFTVYLAAWYLLKKNRIGALIAWGFWLLITFFTYSIYSPSGFLFYRAFEGKTILAVVILPIMLVQMIRSVQSRFAKKDFAISLVMNIGAIPFCMSSMMLLPVLFTIIYIPGIIAYKNRSAIWQWLILNGICVVELLAYLLISKGIWRVLI